MVELDEPVMGIGFTKITWFTHGQNNISPVNVGRVQQKDIKTWQVGFVHSVVKQNLLILFSEINEQFIVWCSFFTSLWILSIKCSKVYMKFLFSRKTLFHSTENFLSLVHKTALGHMAILVKFNSKSQQDTEGIIMYYGFHRVVLQQEFTLKSSQFKLHRYCT